MTEEWRNIPGYPGYQASSLGRVRSFIRSGEGRVLKPCTLQSGHLGLMFGRGRHVSVHVVVALAFVGPKPFDSAEVLHNDGVPNNNVPSNLRWGTRSENNIDVILHGRRQLTFQQAAAIRQSLSVGIKAIRLAEKYGVNRGTITHIKNNREYRA